MTLTERLRRHFAAGGIGRGGAAVPSVDERSACPCCGSLTLPTRGDHELCPVCFWEDDGQDDEDADVVRGAPNGLSSLTQAQADYGEFGACDRAFLGKVRPPTSQEKPTGER